jgi:copper chaperone CopZ
MQTHVSIPGIHCEGCAALIKDVSGDFSAIQSVDIDLATKRVTISHDETFDLAAWSREIEALDPKYTVSPLS